MTTKALVYDVEPRRRCTPVECVGGAIAAGIVTIGVLLMAAGFGLYALALWVTHCTQRER